MKILILILLVGTFLKCKPKGNKLNTEEFKTIKKENLAIAQNKDTIEDILIKKIFNESSLTKKNKDSFSLYNTYTIKVANHYNPIHFSFNECSPFLNKDEFDENFKLLDIIEWNEEALIHKNYYYGKGIYIVILDIINDKHLQSSIKCNKSTSEEFIESIRIFNKSDYLKNSENAIHSYFSKKIK